MKKAMWKVDPMGRFEFSDRDVAQDYFEHSKYTQNDLASYLKANLHGRSVSADELRKLVPTETPEYRYEDAIRILKNEGAVKETRERNVV